MEYSEDWWTLIHEKNLKSKISCQTPFNTLQFYFLCFTVYVVMMTHVSLLTE